VNALKWAKNTLIDYKDKKTTTTEMAGCLRKSAPPNFFSDEHVQSWAWNTLARDVQRSWKTPGIRKNGGSRTYTPVQLLAIDDYRDVLQSCREDKRKYHLKGVEYLRSAVEAGYGQLRLEFPEFNE